MAEFIEATQENISELKTKYSRLLLEFSATWCGPCKVLEPMLHELAEGLTDERFAVAMVNVDNNPDLALEYDVMNVPTMVYLKDGETVDMDVNVPKKADLENKISKFINN